jgi:hypothetical protein
MTLIKSLQVKSSKLTEVGRVAADSFATEKINIINEKIHINFLLISLSPHAIANLLKWKITNIKVGQ